MNRRSRGAYIARGRALASTRLQATIPSKNLLTKPRLHHLPIVKICRDCITTQLATAEDMKGQSVIVSEPNYRYSVREIGGLRMRSALSEYLATEVQSH